MESRVEELELLLSSRPSVLPKIKPVGFTFDMKKIQKQIYELNMMAGDGIAKVVTDEDGHGSLKTESSVPLKIFKNGIYFMDGPFRSFELDPTAWDFVHDIEDGYFPSELKTRYPDGGFCFNLVIFKLEDYHDVEFGADQFIAFSGNGHRVQMPEWEPCRSRTPLLDSPCILASIEGRNCKTPASVEGRNCKTPASIEGRNCKTPASIESRNCKTPALVDDGHCKTPMSVESRACKTPVSGESIEMDDHIKDRIEGRSKVTFAEHDHMEHAIEARLTTPSIPKILKPQTTEAFLSKIPKHIIKDGNVIEMRKNIRELFEMEKDEKGDIYIKTKADQVSSPPNQETSVVKNSPRKSSIVPAQISKLRIKLPTSHRDIIINMFAHETIEQLRDYISPVIEPILTEKRASGWELRTAFQATPYSASQTLKVFDLM